MRSSNTIIQLTRGSVNVYLLISGGHNLLIDTGTSRQRSRIVEKIRQLDISHIDWILLTHSHYDHAANARFIADTFGAQVMIHRLGATLLEQGENPPVKGTNRWARFLANHFGALYLKRQRYEPCHAGHLLENTFDMKELGIDGYILHTPGHSSDSVSLICEDTAFTGDTLFGVFPGKALPPFATDIKKLLESWQCLLTTNCHTFLPGHGKAVTREVLEKEIRRLRSNIN